VQEKYIGGSSEGLAGVSHYAKVKVGHPSQDEQDSGRDHCVNHRRGTRHLELETARRWSDVFTANQPDGSTYKQHVREEREAQ